VAAGRPPPLRSPSPRFPYVNGTVQRGARGGSRSQGPRPPVCVGHAARAAGGWQSQQDRFGSPARGAPRLTQCDWVGAVGANCIGPPESPRRFIHWSYSGVMIGRRSIARAVNLVGFSATRFSDAVAPSGGCSRRLVTAICDGNCSSDDRLEVYDAGRSGDWARAIYSDQAGNPTTTGFHTNRDLRHVK